MIRLLDAASREDYLAACHLNPLYGATGTTLLLAYGEDAKHAMFWVAYHPNGSTSAAISLFDGGICIAANEQTPPNAAELADFLKAVGGFSTIFTSLWLAEALRPFLGGLLYSAPAMRWKGGQALSFPTAINFTPRLSAVFRLICAANPAYEKEARFEPWLAHASHLVRHGLGISCTVEETLVPRATGSVFAMGCGVGIIGSVAVPPQWQKRGLGSRITLALASHLLKNQLVPCLFCRTNQLEQFYAPLGFETVEKWGFLVLEENA